MSRIALLTAAVLSLAAAVPARAQDSDAAFRATTLTLSASGQVRVRPDLAEISLGVEAQAPTAQAAMQDNASRMTPVIAALRSAGVRDADIQTAGINLGIVYRYPANQPPERAGYLAANTVTVRVHDLDRVGPILDAAVAAGANKVNNVSFEVSDRGPPENAARTAAVRELQEKADLYARATGYHIARLVNLTEGGSAQPIHRAAAPPPPPAYQGRVQAVPVSAGELTINETITGVFELTR